MTEFYYNSSNIAAPLQKMMPPINGKSLYMGSNENMPIMMMPHLSSYKKIKHIHNKLLEYLLIMHKQWILLLLQH